MSLNENTPFDGEEIRDTNDHSSDVVYNGDFLTKTLVVENDHNQEGTFLCEGSARSDFSKPYDIGTEWTVAANTTIYQTCESYHKYWRITASYATAPTTGDLTIHILGVKNG